MINNKLLTHFPDGYNPNPMQVKVLDTINQAFEDNYKFVVCNAPTGSGKSMLSKTIGNVSRESTNSFRELVTSYLAFKRLHGGGYSHSDECEEEQPFGCSALTITKSLQDQYKDLFNDVEVLKGKSNYQCSIDPNFPVDVAPCLHLPRIKEECWAKKCCPYYEQRNKTLTAQFNTLNYSMFFSLPEHLKKRQFLICDEASELEDQLVKEFTCKVEYKTLKAADITYTVFTSKTDGYKWLNTIAVSINDKITDLKELISINDKITDLKELISSKSITSNKRPLIDLKSKIIKLLNLHSKINLVIDSWSESEYVYDRNKDGVTFMPLKVNKLAHRLFDYADSVILMSATIIDPSNFCKSLGIDKFKYVEEESSFDPKNAPIICNTKFKLNYYNLKNNLPKITKQIKEICNHHKNDKGIIHTHNNTITKSISNELTSGRYLIREPGVRNEDILEQHSATDEPTVLISPSMTFGVDLKDDLARFQIIVKAPFLPTKDVRIERLMKDDFKWYQNKMLCTLIQSCGRGIRSKRDYCITYILDGTITENIINNKHKLPKYFIDRFM